MQHNELMNEMITYYSGDPKRIQHFLKVFTLAKLIGEGEHLPEETQNVLEMAALVHDIGIKVAEEKYGDCSGKYQEQEGPSVARAMLERLQVEAPVIDRICYLVGHHHTYHAIDGLDYQILVEADFLVNMYEDGLSQDAVATAYRKIFQTETGRDMCRRMFGLA